MHDILHEGTVTRNQFVFIRSKLFSLKAFRMLRHYCCYHAARKQISFCFSLENGAFFKSSIFQGLLLIKKLNFSKKKSKDKSVFIAQHKFLKNIILNKNKMFTKNIVYYINRLLSIEQCFTLILIYKRLSVVTNKSRKKIKQIH